jgi:hypothetical protein
MPTQVTNKKMFIDMLNKQLTDDDIILITRDLGNTIKVIEKRNTKQVTFEFAADSFKRKGDIGHFAFGKTPVIAFSICSKDEASDETIEIFNNI